MRKLKVVSLGAGVGLVLSPWILGFVPVPSAGWKIWASVLLVAALAAAALLAPANEHPPSTPDTASMAS
jgi:apolipoprotein N-acyltransferase